MGSTCSHDKVEFSIENDNTVDTSTRNHSRNVKNSKNRDKSLKDECSKIDEEEYVENNAESTINQNLTSLIFEGLQIYCSSSQNKLSYKLIPLNEFNRKLREVNPNIDKILTKYSAQLKEIMHNYSNNMNNTTQEYKVGPVCFSKADTNEPFSYYNGSFTTDGFKQGYGEEIMEDKSIYMGIYQNGKFSCEGLLIYNNGDYFIGNFYLGKTGNKGTLVLNDYLTYSGEWENNKKHGYGREIYNDGRVYEGNFVQGEKEGKGIENFPDGSYYTGEFKHSKFEGKGEYVWADGRKYKGDFKNGKMDGEGETTWPNGNKYIGKYENGNKKGDGIYYWGKGSYYKGKFLNNYPHGNGIINIDGIEYIVKLRFGKTISVTPNNQENNQITIESPRHIKDRIEEELHTIEQ